MRTIKVLSYVSVLFLLSFSLVGGCGGGGGDSSDNNVDVGPPDSRCEMPPLSSNFSDTGYYFEDSFNSVLIGVTSDGVDVVIVMSDIPDSGARVGAFATPVSSTSCDIYAGVLDTDADFNFQDEQLLQASGECFRLENGSRFQVDNFTAGGVPLGTNLDGQCIDTVNIRTSEMKEMNEKAEEISRDRFEQRNDNGYGETILDFFEELSSE